MSFIFQLLFLSYFNFLIIYCKVFCNKQTTLPPENKYHCSGLEISQTGNAKGDSYCCIWEYSEENKTKTRCSSINEKQFNDLPEYTKNKSAKLENLTIECTAEQSLYCSNVVLDEESISRDDCKNLSIFIEGDMFCCRWNYKNSKSNNKINTYCASINEYEYLTINDYIRYKNDHPNQRYDDLTIDCLGKFFKVTISSALIFVIF